MGSAQSVFMGSRHKAGNDGALCMTPTPILLLGAEPQTAVTASIWPSSSRSTMRATGSNRAWAAAEARGSAA